MTFVLALQLFSPVDPAELAKLYEERIARAPSSLEAKRDLGLYWLRNGHPAQAERWLREAMAGDIFLAEAVAAQGRFDEAEAIFRTCPENARCLTRLANLAERRGDGAEALTRYKDAVEKDATVARRNDYALALQAAGRMKEAEAQFRLGLADSEKRHGAQHPETATTLNNLATLLGATQRAALALPLQRRAVAIFEKTLGPQHPRTRTAKENLADLQ